ncbi:MAG: hypothetical protein E7632_06675 [Ruminococcaceae bacterium]|nr:hypothetical protein [Oscillospiraceae bacterium]
MRVIFSNRAYAAVMAETAEKIRTETGGLFLGAVENDTWYIIEAIDPGPKSIFEIAYFEYDRKYTEHLINKIANLYAAKLSLIGLWHRHPGSFDEFSSTDDGTNLKYASMRTEGAISALVNIDPDFRITMYHVNRACRYTELSYDVGDHLIPDALLRYKTPEQFGALMDSLLHRGTNRPGYHRAASLAGFMRLVEPYLTESEEKSAAPMDDAVQELLADAIIDDLTFLADTLKVETAIKTAEGGLMLYQDAAEGTTKLVVTAASDKKALVLQYGGKRYHYAVGVLTEAYGKAKADKDAAKAEEKKPKKHGEMLNSVIKIITFGRNEEK